MALETSSIRSFFKNQTIFITGGTGFIGKVLVEKLLRECPDLNRIYLLVRPKKGKNARERLEMLFDYECFELLKSKNVNFVKKVILVNGDCQKDSLGLSFDDLEMLKNETTCVIHAAASVKFDQSLKEASQYVRATRDVLLMAKYMPKLKALVYVSTAYSNCLNSHVKEDFYQPPINPDDFLTLVNALDEDTQQAITPYLLGKWPNTYVFSKCISENLVKTLGADLPVSIVRPAIIFCSYQEPVNGWIDNFYGAVGLSLCSALGVLGIMHAKINCRVSLVPVDYVVNIIIAAAAQTDKTTKIYNFGGHKSNQLTWGKFLETLGPYSWDTASEKIIWYSRFKFTENEMWHNVYFFLTHTMLAYIVDFVLKCLGRKPLAVENYRKLNKLLKLLMFFTTHEWKFDQENLYGLWEKMSVEDKKSFHFMMDKIDFNEWMKVSAFGARKYILKESIDTIPKGKRKLCFFFVAHYTFLVLFYYALYRLTAFVIRLFCIFM